MNNTNIKVSLRVIGDTYDTDEISKELCIKPTKTLKKGEPIRTTGKHYDYTAWIYGIEACETLDVNAQLSNLRECFVDKVDKLVKLKKEFDLEISIDVAIVVEKDELPAIYMDSEVVKFVAGLDARIDFDLYIN